MRKSIVVMMCSMLLMPVMAEEIAADALADDQIMMIEETTGDWGEAYNEDYERDPCDFRSFQLPMVEQVSDMFVAYAEERIVMRLFTDPAYQDLVREVTDEFVMSLENTLDVCRDGQDELYDWRSPMSMGELSQQVITYAELIHALRHMEDKVGAVDIVEEQFAVLQEHILGDMVDYIRNNVFIEKAQDFAFMLDLMHDEIDMTMELDMVAHGKGDMVGTTTEGNLMLDTMIDIAQDTGTVMVEGGIDVDVRVVDGHMYLRLNDANIDVASTDMEDADRAELDKMLESMKLVEGKWIDVFGGIGGGMSTMMFEQVLGQQQDMIQALFGSSWLITYAEEDDIYFAGINPLVCSSFALFGSVSDCLVDMRWSSYDATDGQGFVMMQQYKDSYTMALTDRFMDEKMPEEMQVLNNKEVIAWNDDKIIRIDVPLSDFGTLLYTNNRLTIDAVFPHEQYDRETDTWTTSMIDATLNGTMQSSVIDLVGTVTSDTFDASFAWDQSGGIDDMTLDIRFDIETKGDEWTGPWDMSFTLEGNASQEVIDTVDIVAPSQDEIVDLSVFDMM